MITFPASEKVADGLQRYFDHYHFDNGGYNDKSFKVKFWGPLVLTIPNTTGRLKAVKFHDIHHMVTQFEANLRGEAEIGAWEIAAGCRKYTAALVLNSCCVIYGFLIWPGKIYKAFIWGRRCETLYYNLDYKEYEPELLSATVGQLREQLGLNKTRNQHLINDNFRFVLMLLVIYGPMLIGLGLAVFLIRIFF